ncbi:hypothetical protein NW765_012399 [Fusarium oxysporum]|nr:hypothetical protein NW765_012399 [Fusarium oxysporum]
MQTTYEATSSATLRETHFWDLLLYGFRKVVSTQGSHCPPIYVQFPFSTSSQIQLPQQYLDAVRYQTYWRIDHDNPFPWLRLRNLYLLSPCGAATAAATVPTSPPISVIQARQLQLQVCLTPS